MKQQLTAILTAAAIAFTGSAAPAMAQTDEELLGKIIAGAAILGITAKIIDDRKDRKRAEAKKKKAKTEQLGYWQGDRRIIDGEIRGHNPKKGRKARNVPLPRQCRVTVDTPRGDRTGYGSRCLEERFDFARQLPRDCEVLVRTSRGLRGVYGERCLARDGWKTARR